MGWKMIEFFCEACSQRFDHLASDEEQKLEALPCSDCGAEAIRVISAPSVVTIVPGNSDFAQRQTERLDKRHFDYVRGRGRDELIDRKKAVHDRVIKKMGERT